MEQFRRKNGKNRRKYRMPVWLAVAAVVCIFVGGCSIKETNGTKVSDLAYVIVEEADLPEELAVRIEEKKASDFKLTYEAESGLYIVRGYGEQETGGYSISIRECYLTSNAVVFDTELIGPRKGENTCKGPSYPYIVIKTEKRDENVIFE